MKFYRVEYRGGDDHCHHKWFTDRFEASRSARAWEAARDDATAAVSTFEVEPSRKNILKTLNRGG